MSGLGFSFYISQLHSGTDHGSVVRIKRLFPGKPALESGLLREGDVILSVNKEPVKDLSYQAKCLKILMCHSLFPQPQIGASIDDVSHISSLIL